MEDRSHLHEINQLALESNRNWMLGFPGSRMIIPFLKLILFCILVAGNNWLRRIVENQIDYLSKLVSNWNHIPLFRQISKYHSLGRQKQILETWLMLYEALSLSSNISSLFCWANPTISSRIWEIRNWRSEITSQIQEEGKRGSALLWEGTL